MKSRYVLLGVAALAAAALWFWFEQRPEPFTLTGERPAMAQPARPRSADHGGPQLAARQVTPAVASQVESVTGIMARRDRNCTVTRHYLDLGNGTVTEAVSCNGPGLSPGAYDHYDNGTLEQLAYADAGAASVLGKRLVEADPDKARSLILRALALQPDDVEPAMWLASQAYSLRGSSVAARRATADSYVITRIAQELGADVAVTWIVDDLRTSGFDDADLASLDARVVRDLRRIGDIQQDVYGERTIREDLP